MTATRYDVIGIGNAIVDVIARADDDFLVKHGMAKGGMSLIDEPRAEAIYKAMGPATEISGGSAANTIAGVASFGGKAAFVGSVRDDTLGGVFAHDIRASGVAFKVPPFKQGPSTGRSYILVTPDGERTMNTYLGRGATSVGEGNRRARNRRRENSLHGRVSLGSAKREGRVFESGEDRA